MLLDIAARRMGMDPMELRRRNLLRREDLPYANPNGMTYDSISPIGDVRAGPGDARLRRLPRRAGRGARGRPLPRRRLVQLRRAVDARLRLYATEAATIRIEPSGAVNVYIAGGSTGNSLETTVVQLTADALGVNIDDVNTIQGDTAVTGFGAGAAGSRSASMTAGAVRDTSAILRDRIAAIAAHRFEAAPDDIEIADSRAFVRGTPAIGISLGELAALAYFEPSSLPPGMPAGLEASARYTAAAPVIWVNATHVCTCEVDVTTGLVTLLRYIVSEDCGPMINPNVVEGQIAGGVAQGIGGALYEHLAYDDDGNPVTTTFMDYLLPDRVRGARDRVRAHRDREPGPGRLQGRGRRRRDRRAAVRRQRGGRRALAVRSDRDAPAAHPFGHRGAARRSERKPAVTTTSTSEVYYDPYDVEIDADPYPVFRRLREEAPLYYNEQHDFYAVSRYEDVERGVVDNKTFISGRGGILEMIKANIEMPSGVLIFEDPPVHTIHRSLLSRVFTPRRMAALEPKIREFCARSLDPLVGAGGFDFIADLGAQMPMRTIGMLLGIPEAGPGGDPRPGRRQPAHRSRASRCRPRRSRSSAARCSPTTSTGAPSIPPTTS